MTDPATYSLKPKDGGPSRIGSIVIRELNVLADRHFAGDRIVTSWPATPSFWFFACATGLHVVEHQVIVDGLSPRALKLLELGGIRERGTSGDTDDRWCTCEDAEFNARYEQWGPAICWPCVFQCHERCSVACTWEGRVSFPELVIGGPRRDEPGIGPQFRAAPIDSTEGRLSPDHVPHQEAPACPHATSATSSPSTADTSRSQP